MERHYKFQYLEFLPDGIKVWKAYNIDSGHFYRNDEIDRLSPNVCKQEQFEVVEIDSFSSPKNVEGNIKLQKDNVEMLRTVQQVAQKHFFCSEPGCIIAFKSFSSLEQHISSENMIMDWNVKAPTTLLKEYRLTNATTSIMKSTLFE